MKTLRYLGPSDVLDLRQVPGLANDEKFVVVSPDAVFDGNGGRVPAERRGSVITVTDAQAEELLTANYGRFVEVPQEAPAKAAGSSKPASSAAGEQ